MQKRRIGKYRTHFTETPERDFNYNLKKPKSTVNQRPVYPTLL